MSRRRRYNWKLWDDDDEYDDDFYEPDFLDDYGSVAGMSTPSKAADAIKLQWDWESLFDPKILSEGKSPAMQKKILSVSRFSGGYHVSFKGNFYVTIENLPTVLGQRFYEDDSFFCSRDTNYFGGSHKCVHIAAAMYYLEHKFGHFELTESEYNYQTRKQYEKAQEQIRERNRVRLLEGENVRDYLISRRQEPKEDPYTVIDVPAVGKNMTASREVIKRAEMLSRTKPAPDANIDCVFGPLQVSSNGVYSVSFQMNVDDTVEYVAMSGTISGNRMTGLSYKVQSMNQYHKLEAEKEYSADFYENLKKGTGKIDEYVLLLLIRADDELRQYNQGQLTSKGAETFLNTVSRQMTRKIEASAALPEEQAASVRDLVLTPRITADTDGPMTLSFKINRIGSRQFIVKNITELLDAVRSGGTYALGKRDSIDFGKEDFTEDSARYMQYLLRRVGSIGAFNEQLANRNPYYYTPYVGVSKEEELSGTSLDLFYEAAEGGTAEYQNKSAGIKGEIRIAHETPKVDMNIGRIGDLNGKLAGVMVSGTCPVVIQGATGSYVLTDRALSRISDEEKRTLEPFQSVSSGDGSFRFQVGRANLQEFYYRALPAFLENPMITVQDNCEEEAKNILPPEPEFIFYMDFDEDVITCRPTVRYGETTYNVRSKSSGYRDTLQEHRVLDVVGNMFGDYDVHTASYYAKMDDERLYRFLMSDLQLLSEYGTVVGTDAFRKLKVVRPPQVSIGVSVDVGLTNLDITSKDVTKEELIDILRSCKLKKRYHRLKSGDFVDLHDAMGLEELEQFLNDLDLNPEEAIQGKAHIPQYRALYVDKLLEQHDALVAERSHTMRSIVKNFQTVRDADYEAPPEVREILRPYQEYGFKWLETLEKTGFGGILADEMGLGKTLQMIAVFAYDRYEEGDEAKQRTSLVVCPASLVYNWQEEIRRFAPDLNAVVIAGTKSEREKLLKELDTVDVAITSYDLLKRDIALYSGLTFHICVIDEAQNIKNVRAEQTKAVKTVRAKHRFALTGTPIENRLSELWSIFDFLMPGLLYSAPEFEEKFERPITKNKDEDAIRRLRAMTGPFILRRKKEDVLKDLPAKLEEVRYARLSGQQQKLYDAQVAHMRKMLRSDMDKNEIKKDKIRILAELTRIREICCDPSLVFEDYKGESAKREAVMDLIESAISGGHRMLVFSQFTSMLDLLEKDLEEKKIPCYVITGATSKEKRIQLVHAFNEGDVPVFLISLKAGGTGLNLTGADMVIHYDPWWNLAAQNQATDRAHRIGQTKQVTVYRMIAKGTIEEKIMQLQEAKKDLAEAILEGESSSIFQLSGEELLALLDE